MKIIRYRVAGDMAIEFQDKHKFIVNTTYSNFIKGQIKNPYDKSIYGVGYLGIGKYEAHDENGINTKPYDTWTNMIERCYSEKTRHKHMAYIDCTVCEEWLNYQTFAKWYEENYYEITTERMHIDKDILMKDNKVYSPSTCMFVPQRINMIFMKKNREVDADLPTGIRRCVGGYQTTYNGEYIGIFKELNKALEVYNVEKQLHINEVAEEYKDIISPKLYYALLNWNRKLAA